MSKKHFKLSKGLSLVITVIICVFAVVCLFTPVFKLTSGVFATETKNVNITGVDVLSALFSSDTTEDSFADVLKNKDNTGHLTALAVKNNEEFSTRFMLMAVSFFCFLILCAILLILTIILATFYNKIHLVGLIYKYSHYVTAFLSILTFILMAVCSGMLSYTLAPLGIVVFALNSVLQSSFYFMIIAAVVCVPAAVFCKNFD